MQFEIYKLTENIGKAQTIDFETIKTKCFEVKKEIFDVLQFKERQQLFHEAIDYMRSIYYSWLDTMKMVLNLRKVRSYKDEELVPIADEIGNSIGYFSAHTRLNDEINAALITQKDRYNEVFGEDVLKKMEPNFGNVVKSKESVGVQHPIFIKKEQINRWTKVIDEDEEIRQLELIILRITSEM
jgi:hypothetical protein